MFRRTQCRIRGTGQSTTADDELSAQRDVDVASLIRPEDPTAGRFKEPDGLCCRMSEPVALAHADHGDLRLQHCEHFGSDRSTTAVMPDLQHVDIGQRAAYSELLQDLTLGIAGQEHPHAVVLNEQNHTRRVLCGVVDGLTWPEHSHAHAPHYEAVSRSDPARSDASLSSLPPERPRLARSGHHQLAHGEDPGQRTRTPGVVIVRMREHDPVQRPHAGADERLTQRARRGPGVDQDRGRTITNEDGIALPHIERRHERAVRRARSCEHDEQHEYRRGAHDPRARSVWSRPPRPQRQSAPTAQKRNGKRIRPQRDRRTRQGRQQPRAGSDDRSHDPGPPQHHVSERRDRDTHEQSDDGDHEDDGDHRSAYDVGQRSDQGYDPERGQRYRQRRRLSDQRQRDRAAQRSQQRG